MRTRFKRTRDLESKVSKFLRKSRRSSYASERKEEEEEEDEVDRFANTRRGRVRHKWMLAQKIARIAPSNSNVQND